MGPKLYYTSHSCSAASFIAAWSIRLNIDCEQVDTQTHKTHSGLDFYSINPKGNVPCLVLNDGTILNENVAVLNWIADQVGLINTTMKIAPLNGTQDRYMVMNCLSFVATELHPTIGGLFAKNSEEITNWMRNKCDMKLRYLENVLLCEGKEFLVWQDAPTIADFYCFVVLSWCEGLVIDLSGFPRTLAFHNRMSNMADVRDSQSRMAQNPTCIMGTYQERTEPVLERITEVMKPTTDKVQEGIENMADYANQKMSDLKDKFTASPTSKTATTEQQTKQPMTDL